MATLLAHAQTLLRSKTVDLTFDGEQDIDALDRLAAIGALVSRARSKKCAQQAASTIGPGSRLAW